MPSQLAAGKAVSLESTTAGSWQPDVSTSLTLAFPKQEALIYGEALDGPTPDSAPGQGPSAAAGPAAAGAGGAAAAAGAAGQPAGAGLKYGLKIVDSLVNIGPIRDMSVGGLGGCLCLLHYITNFDFHEASRTHGTESDVF